MNQFLGLGDLHHDGRQGKKFSIPENLKLLPELQLEFSEMDPRDRSRDARRHLVFLVWFW